ncbi:MAG: TonB-dependent receptor [Nitrospirota bacterium]|nr:TonB-dependent receptor [Nitrospirota bacterium]
MGAGQLNTGVRYDLHSDIKPTTSPQISLTYQPFPEHTFLLSGNFAYRPPTVFERSFVQKTSVTLPLPPPFNIQTTVIQGSENLRPEKILSISLNYQGWYFKHRLRLRTDVFFNKITRLIIFQESAPGMVIARNSSGEANIFGGEGQFEVLINPWLQAIGNLAYQKINQSFSRDVRSGPKIKINGGFRGNWESGLNGEVLIHYVKGDSYPINDLFNQLEFLVSSPNAKVHDYTLLNIRAGYSFWDDQAEVAVSVFNALNDRHKEHPLGDTIGSRVLGWLTLKFD